MLVSCAAAAGEGAFSAGLGERALESIAARVKGLPPLERRAALAAAATEEGHWRFVNRSGEIFTAGTPEELKRVASVLLPDAKGDVGLALYVDEDTIFRHRQALADLPTGSELNVVIGADSYRLRGRSERPTEQLFAEVRPNLLVEMREPNAFREAVWQLARPLAGADVRVLALEPGGPSTLTAAPRIDPASKRALIDTIDPASLPAALGAVRGQTVLITGRIAGRLITVQPVSGAERSLILADLFAAAEEADVNLVVLHAATTPRQPGGRNWLWQKVEVKGLDSALQHARLADFFDALGARQEPFVVSAAASSRRTSLALSRGTQGAGPASPIGVGDRFSGLISDLTGRVVIAGVAANLRSAERQRELEARIIPGIPADVQLGYLILVVLGLFGLPASRASWRRLWPPEIAADYAGRTGYLLAAVVRGLVFLLLFLPLSAPLSVPYVLAKAAAEAAAAPVRLWRRLLRGAAANG